MRRKIYNMYERKRNNIYKGSDYVKKFVGEALHHYAA